MEEFTESEYDYIAELLANVFNIIEAAGGEDETIEAFIEALQGHSDITSIEDEDDETEESQGLFERLRNMG